MKVLLFALLLTSTVANANISELKSAAGNKLGLGLSVTGDEALNLFNGLSVPASSWGDNSEIKVLLLSGTHETNGNFIECIRVIKSNTAECRIWADHSVSK